jgi:hypothetical protein
VQGCASEAPDAERAEHEVLADFHVAAALLLIKREAPVVEQTRERLQRPEGHPGPELELAGHASGDNPGSVDDERIATRAEGRKEWREFKRLRAARRKRFPCIRRCALPPYCMVENARES